MSFTNCLVVMTGGAIGTLLRYLVSTVSAPIDHELPWGTVLINVTGSFTIGLFGTLTLAHGRYPASETLRLFVMIGICGGYTTFSSFSLQTLDLLREGALARAGVNVVLSVVLCVCAVTAGHLAASALNGDARAVAQVEIEEEA